MFSKLSQYLNNSKKDDIFIILDDIFPHYLSAFRIAEYTEYLKKYPNSKVCSTASAFPLIGEKRHFKDIVSGYEDDHPELVGRVRKYSRSRYQYCKLIYTIFLNNACIFIDIADKYNIPFVFTLYPGGGFQINQEVSDSKLKKVCSSPNLKKIITTQKISHQYLLDKYLVPENKLEFVYGGVFPSIQSSIKPFYKKDKSTFDICFVSHKYMQGGHDKGFDIFLKVVELLAKFIDIQFHIVGSFDNLDVESDNLKKRINFYGVQKTDFFIDFYSKMDIILSPNSPFILAPGAFDGFPTGCCIEAGLCGVAVFCTDPLNQNIYFKHKESINIISNDSKAISEAIFDYYLNPSSLYILALNGQVIFKQVFKLEDQMSPRFNIIDQFVGMI